jgi:nitrate reductase assembly molybdenum cofactor insertion protein NarJ
MNAPSDGRAQELVAQAAAWRLAALLLERPRTGWHEEIQKLSAEVSDSQLSACASQAEKASEERYHQLFGPGAAISPREVSYSGFEDPGRLMAELNAFYHAFAFEPRREESVDHLSVEAGFVGYLLLKEAYSHMREDDESAAITRSARKRFMEEHLQRCARGMSERLSDAPRYLQDVLMWMAEKTSPGPSC